MAACCRATTYRKLHLLTVFVQYKCQRDVRERNVRIFISDSLMFEIGYHPYWISIYLTFLPGAVQIKNFLTVAVMSIKFRFSSKWCTLCGRVLGYSFAATRLLLLSLVNYKCSSNDKLHAAKSIEISLMPCYQNANVQNLFLGVVTILFQQFSNLFIQYWTTKIRLIWKCELSLCTGKKPHSILKGAISIIVW